MRYTFLISLTALVFAQAEVVSPTRNFNVTLPEPNTPYVAGQMLPISYTLPDNDRLPTHPSLNFTQVTLTSNADISQGFSFKRMRGADVYYEHQLSYAIPNSTIPGNYNVIFADSISNTNVTVPILVRPYAPPITASPSNGINRSSPSGSIFGSKSNASTESAMRTVLWMGIMMALLVHL